MDYIFIDEHGQLVDGHNNHLNRDLHSTQMPRIVWVSSENLTFLNIKMPTRNAGALEQSIPYAVEDHLLCDVDDMHFAWFATSKDELLPLVAVARDRMDLWSARLQQAGVVSAQLVPDIFLVPYRDKPTLLILENRSILRIAEFQVISGSHQWITEYLKHKKISKVDLASILLPGAKLPDVWKQYNPVSGQQAELELQSSFNENRLINLLQGDYGSGFGMALRHLRHISLPLVAMFIVGVLLVSNTIIKYFEINSEKEQLEQLVITKARSIVDDFQLGNPLRPLVNRRIKQSTDKLKMQKSSSWAVLEKATTLLSKCSNCVYDNITLEDNGFSFDVSSFNSLEPLERIFKDLKTYDVETELIHGTNKNEIYYRLKAKIEVKG